jgi:hypothetical protein
VYQALFLLITALFFSSCASLNYTYNTAQKSLDFRLDKEKPYHVVLQNPTLQPQFDACSSYSYTLKDDSAEFGKLFIEHISLHSNCQFNAQSLGFFLYEFKEQLKLKKFTKLLEQLHGNYEFLTYKINDTSVVNFIFIYSSFDYTFIVDYEGKLFQTLLQHFDILNENDFSNLARFDVNYDYSLVRMNLFKGYFTRISEDNFN